MIVHFVIFFLLSILVTAVFFFIAKLPEMKREVINFDDNEAIKGTISMLKIIFGIVVSFAVFISSKTVIGAMKNNKQKIGILKSIGSSSLSIFMIYFIQTSMILFLSFLCSMSLQFLAFGDRIDFIENIKNLSIMTAYLVVVSVVSVLIPVLFFMKKSIISMLKKKD